MQFYLFSLIGCQGFVVLSAFLGVIFIVQPILAGMALMFLWPKPRQPQWVMHLLLALGTAICKGLLKHRQSDCPAKSYKDLMQIR